MLVAELSDPRQFRLVDSAPPSDPAPGEIQVAVRAVGICGSDLHYFSEGGIGGARCIYPMVLGHEPAGVVVKTGAGVSGWATGDRVVMEPALYCYHCEFCMTGRHNVCANLRFLSVPGEEPGFFREFVNLPVDNVLPLPSNMSDAEGALVEPLAVALHSMKFALPQPGETVVVFGAGPIGLLTIALLKLSGASRIWSVEPVAARRELARALGADAVIDPSADPVRAIFEDTAKRGVDLAIDCASRGDSINQCIYAVRNAGRVVVTGIPSEDHIRLAFHIMRRKEAAFYTVRRSNHDSAAALRLLSAEPRRFAPMLTHQRPVSDVQAAFELCEAYADAVGKMTLRF